MSICGGGDTRAGLPAQVGASVHQLLTMCGQVGVLLCRCRPPLGVRRAASSELTRCGGWHKCGRGGDLRCGGHAPGCDASTLQVQGEHAAAPAVGAAVELKSPPPWGAALPRGGAQATCAQRRELHHLGSGNTHACTDADCCGPACAGGAVWPLVQRAARCGEAGGAWH